MQSLIELLLLCLPVLLVSFIGAIFWLSIPLLLQVIVDKVLLQNSPDTLNILCIALLVSSLMANGLDIWLNGIIATLVRNHRASRESFLHLATVLPRALLILLVMTIYNPQIAVVAAVLTAIACGSYFLLNRLNIRSKPIIDPLDLLPLSFRIPVILVVLLVLWQGASLVLSGQLTIGQWISIAILNLQLATCLLSFTTLAFCD